MIDEEEVNKLTLQYLESHQKCGLKQYFENVLPEVYRYIINYSDLLNDSKYSFSHKLYWCINKIHDFPECPVCGERNTRVITMDGYIGNKKYCSHKCSVSTEDCLKKRKNTLIDKYGVDSPIKNKVIREKIKQTCLERYGTENPIQSKEIKEKIHNTVKKRYNVDYICQACEVKEKMRKWNEWLNHNPEEKEKIRKKYESTMIKRYGVSVPLKNPKFLERLKLTNLEKYGTEWYTQQEEFIDKSRTTRNNKYGNWHPLDYNEKVIKTNNDRYGKNYYSQTPDYIRKVTETNLNRYKVDFGLKNEEIREKSKYTQIRKYGCIYVKTKEFLEKCKNTNFQRYGANWGIQNKEIKEKSKRTILEKYGVDNIFKSEIFKRKIRIKKYINTYNRLLKSSYFEPLFSIHEFLNHSCDELLWKCKQCGSIIKSKRSGCLKIEDSMYVRCEKCYPMHNHSVAEKQVEFYFKKYDPDCHSDKLFLENGKEIDIKSDKYKICIEFDGLYWHSNKLLNFDKNYHLSKTKICESKNYQLIHIFEDEWEYKQDIVKSRLRSLCGDFDFIVFARKCEVRNVSFNESRDFLNENHLQGHCNSKVRLGLYFKNQLISLMTFGGYRKSLGRIKKDNEFEMLRFCNKLGYHIPGAASKLLNNFIKIYNPIKIISYCDKRWSTGKLYKALGFIQIKETEPNYWYIIDGKREHRFAWRKSSLKNKLKIFDETKTEYQNMLDNGIDCIYDCGNILFELNINQSV